ncbi:MAG: YIP1 family protein [Acidaminococcaceae bacterium]
MRRKSYDVLFEPKQGMAFLMKAPTLWRSLFYFIISAGAFMGVVTNVWLAEHSLSTRFAVLAGLLITQIVFLVVYSCFLHGLLDACGVPGGDIEGLLCIMGYTALPYLVLTPVALLGVKLGGIWLGLILLAFLVGGIWWVFLLVRALQVVYLIDFLRAAATVCLSLLLLAVIMVMPIYLLVKMLLLQWC